MITMTGPYDMDLAYGSCMSFDWPTRLTHDGYRGGPYLLFKSCGHFCYGIGTEPCCGCTGRPRYECHICPSGSKEERPRPKGKT